VTDVIRSLGQQTRVLILSHDLVGPNMAGPGIRYWELARVLAQTCRVTLAAPLAAKVPSADWRVCPLTLDQPSEVSPLLVEADVVISSGFLSYNYPQLMDLEIPWVIDVYIPSPTEGLAYYQSHRLDEQMAAHRSDTDRLNRFFSQGDFFLCASERQRDLYLGILASVGRLNPYTYAQDPTFRHLIDVVPFGLPEKALVHHRTNPDGKTEGMEPRDKIILWGGGLWDWLDPLTLIEAMALVVQKRGDVRLHFPGTRHPFGERVPDMPMRKRAMALSDRLGLTGKHVRFGEWVPYQERESYLVEADIGASLHLSGIESRFAFRTRVLDYIWAGLPMVLTRGDVLADLVEEHDLGILVASEDTEGVADALLRLLAEQDDGGRDQRFDELAGNLRWEVVAAPLMAYCRDPWRAADKVAGYHLQPGVGDALPFDPKELRAARTRVVELEQLVAAYERGRFMRVMARLKSWQNRLLGRRGG